ncbi:MAG: hypothetical protein COA96_10335 [SAR86 cluster bacterium]|uniref:Uncharacterized protein n=1 Tax=SAR86 cluster bacterium TaxID=2030880 RepID=A0A2A5AXV4_9GAMM|nr:MAG: hypothetical protein COA96_10335 [SAR86 cluster bacterium]
MSDEWTDWRDHDGKGVPVPIGMFAEWVFCDFNFEPLGQSSGMVKGGNSWLWAGGINRMKSNPARWAAPFTRYRIRKPRALQQLIEMVETLPVPVKHLETTE